MHRASTIEREAWPSTLPQPAKVIQVHTENERTRTLVLDLELAARPGQFVMVWLPGIDEKPFSLAGAHPVTLTIVDVGPFSHALHALAPGDRLSIRGPFGQSFRLQGPRALLVGGGYGAAPLGFLAEELLSAGHAVTTAIGARTSGDLLLGRFRQLGVPIHLTTEDGSEGTHGKVMAAVMPLLARSDVDVVYGCGPNGLLETLDEVCSLAGLPAQLSWERHMRCGIGVCGSCEHHGVVLCKEGPVLPGGARA